MPSLVSLAEKYECTIIVDAAHALGSEEVGSVGVDPDQSAASMTCFLFILSKPLQQGKEVRFQRLLLSCLENLGNCAIMVFFVNRISFIKKQSLDRVRVEYVVLRVIRCCTKLPTLLISTVPLAFPNFVSLIDFCKCVWNLLRTIMNNVRRWLLYFVPLKDLKRPRTGWHLFSVLVILKKEV